MPHLFAQPAHSVALVYVTEASELRGSVCEEEQPVEVPIAANAAQLALTGAEEAVKQLKQLVEQSQPVDVEAQRARSQELTLRRAQLTAVQRELHTRLTTNRTALEQIQGKTAQLAQLEQRYTWVRTLSNTVNGTLPGKEKIALETYVQMTFFDRILRRANLRLLVMTGGQYELKRRREAADGLVMGIILLAKSIEEGPGDDAKGYTDDKQVFHTGKGRSLW